MPQLILVLLIVGVAIFLLYYLAIIAFYALGSVLVGWLVFGVGLLVSRTQLGRTVIGAFPQQVRLSNAKDKLRFVLASDAVNRVNADVGWEVLAGLLSAIIAFLVYLQILAHDLLAPYAEGHEKVQGFLELTCLILAAAGLATAIFYTLRAFPRRKTIERRLDKQLEELNSRAARADTFFLATEENLALRKALGGVERPCQELLEEVQMHLKEILREPKHLQQLVDRYTRELQAENATLVSLDQGRCRLQDMYDRACREANRAGNEAVFRYLDLMSNGIRSLQEIAAQDKWEELGRLQQEALAELEQLLQNIDQLSNDSDDGTAGQVESPTTSRDAYSVLGIRSDLPTDELKRVYRELVQIYHPDKGRVADHSRFVAIQHAWETIRVERGL